MKLYAISDLHLSNPANMEAFLNLGYYPEDWLILAGDIAERIQTLELAFKHASERFKQVIWVPGNHELWSIPEEDGSILRGKERYCHLVDLARKYGVASPEDPYLIWPEGQLLIVPMFLLYDYSFAPSGMSREEILVWAGEQKSVAADETLLSPKPYASLPDWCAKRCHLTEERLLALDPDIPKVLINHFPLRQDLVYIPRIPRFIPWCGTKTTHDWHSRFNAKVVVSGHLHVRRTDWVEGVRFEEVSLGYASQWDQEKKISAYLREILPGPAQPD